MPRRRYDSWWNKIGRIVFSSTTRDALIFCFFLVVSAGFWLLQKLDDTFEVQYDIPLRLLNVPRNVMVTTPLPDKITVTIRDRGTNLAHYVRYPEFRKELGLEFSMYESGVINGHSGVPLSHIKHAMEMRLLTSTQVVAIRPDTLEFYFNNGYHVKKPVRMAGEIKTTAQNYLQSVSFVPDSVIVYAPKGVCDTITGVDISPVHIDNLSQTRIQTVFFAPKKGILYSPQKVQMTAKVDYYTEQSVKVPIIGLNFPADKTLRTFPAYANITYRVGAAHSRELSSSNFVVAITYEELLSEESSKYKLHLKSIPEGVTNVRITPEEVDYLVEQTDAEED